MKYKVGDKVRIKSIDWYNANKDENGDIPLIETTYSSYNFIEVMRGLCGKVMTISSDNSYYYDMVEDNGEYFWTDEMIEGLVEKETKPKYEDEVNGEYYSTPKYLVRPSGYQFVDENGNVINAQKITLEKKKNEYPKTYDECNRVMGVELWNTLWGEDATEYEEQMEDLIDAFIRLKVCRDAYWKIAGEEMGLGKPWEPTMETVYCISRNDNVIKCSYRGGNSNILEFPTPEMRDTFYENFKELIERCKELL